MPSSPLILLPTANPGRACGRSMAPFARLRTHAGSSITCKCTSRYPQYRPELPDSIAGPGWQPVPGIPKSPVASVFPWIRNRGNGTQQSRKRQDNSKLAEMATAKQIQWRIRRPGHRIDLVGGHLGWPAYPGSYGIQLSNSAQKRPETIHAKQPEPEFPALLPSGDFCLRTAKLLAGSTVWLELVGNAFLKFIATRRIRDGNFAIAERLGMLGHLIWQCRRQPVIVSPADFFTVATERTSI